MQKIYLVLGTILAGLGVVLGAFGAHGLKKFVGPETLATYQTGVQYQLYHAFALLAVGLLQTRFSNAFLQWAGLCFVTGTVLFSGSLYLLASLKAMNRTPGTAVVLLTPAGGLFFILGWILLLVGILRR